MRTLPVYASESLAPNGAAERLPGVEILHGERWSGLAFERPRTVLSSAPVHGGVVEADRIVNLCVDGPDARRDCDDPAGRFNELGDREGWSGTTVGMMTGVRTERMGIGFDEREDIAWLVLATLGTSNAHRAGEAPVPAAEGTGAGTINIIAACSCALTPAARAESLMLATEARCAFLADAGIQSVNKRGIATGTGTDAVAVAGGTGTALPYAGYHTQSGPSLARATRAALAASLAARKRDD